MSLETFATSRALTLGVELELQLVSTHDYDLTPAAADLLRLLGKRKGPGSVVPEITDSMIELSTGICEDHAEVLAQLTEIRDALVRAADKLGVALSGGGTHPFQDWSQRRIFDKPRFRQISELYGYLSKQFTIFGQHVHVGCPSSDEALFLLHCLSRYIPQLIALTASSPFVQGVDTGFSSARLNSVFAFPLSGRAPFVTNWQDFERFFDKMTATGVVSGMKDFYWDIWPKPEFGTIEVRVCDTPLTVEHAADIACYIQALARMLSIDRGYRPEEDDYLVYNFNRFQACRFGLDGTFVDPKTRQHRSIREDILITLDSVQPHADALEATAACGHIEERVREGRSDAQWCRDSLAGLGCFHELAKAQSALWMGD